MSQIDRFLNENVVILIPSNYEDSQIEQLQMLIDIHAGMDVRFRKTGTILDWCQKKGRNRLDVCINYEDGLLLWCDTEWYADKGYEVISIDEAIGTCAHNISEEDFKNVFEME